MSAPVQITVWHWAGFIGVIILLLALDLGIFHRAPGVIKPRQALLATAAWVSLALLFALVLFHWRGHTDALEFVTGYFVEFSLSLDNMMAIAVIFAFFNVAGDQQHRLLFWGIFGALILRGVMIGLGAALLQTFHWVLFLMAAFLIFTGIKWGFSKQAAVQPDKNVVLRMARKILPVTNEFHGGRFWISVAGRRLLTPLALVLLMIETTDLIFAVDSIPAIFAVTQKAFLVFTSNAFAILGLRSLYFALAGALQYFRFLKIGLAAVLVFVGLKMLALPWYQMPTEISLLVVAAILTGSIMASVLAVQRGRPK